MAGHHSQIRHAHATLSTLIDERQAPHQFNVMAMRLGKLLQKMRVDVVNDLQVAWQDTTHHLDRPCFKGLVHECVVGVRENPLTQLPSMLPRQAMLIKQQAHEFGHSQHRVGVVQVHTHLVGQFVKRVMCFEIATQQILHTGTDKKVLLVQTQLTSTGRGVIGVQHTRDVF